MRAGSKPQRSKATASTPLEESALGPTLQFLVIEGEFTRECLALEVDRSIFLKAASDPLSLRKRLRSTWWPHNQVVQQKARLMKILEVVS